MVQLGLLPPYSEEDVRRAFHTLSQTAHPDRGGSVEAFVALKQAHDQAVEYVHFWAGRTRWITGQVERYARQQAVVAAIHSWGGNTELETTDWLKRTFGDDFAVLTERLVGISLRGLANCDPVLDFLGAHKSECADLHWLDLHGSGVTDDGIRHLPHLDCLKRLDLGETAVTGKGLEILRTLGSLEWINLAGTQVGWLARQRLHWQRSNLTILTHEYGPALPTKL
jgi:hypothetical protein